MTWDGKVWKGSTAAIGNWIATDILTDPGDDLTKPNREHWDLVAQLMARECYGVKFVSMGMRRN
jgi:hypothetical protein